MEPIGAAPNGDLSGQSYVVFGRNSGFNASLELASLDGTNGFALNGGATNDQSGASVSSAGDVNGDGRDDLIIGAPGTAPNGSNSGQSYVVLDTILATATVPENTLTVATITASDADNDRLNFAISGGDDNTLFTINATTGNLDFINAPDFETPLDADGDNRYLVEVEVTDGKGGRDTQLITVDVTDVDDANDAPQITFGSQSASFELSSLNGRNGFVLNGSATSDRSGRSVSSAGDINGDGFDDLIIGADTADPNGNESGQSYVVFGRGSGFSDSLDLASLDGTNGFALNGGAASDWSGFSTSSAGDVNGDGLDDLIIGARGADLNGKNSGQSYVVFGP